RPLAGRSATARFKERRRQAIRANWRDWVALGAIAVGALLAIRVLTGLPQLLFAGLLGAVLMAAVVGWLVGDIHALPWLWGALGEELTEDALRTLDDSWTCEHDIAGERGNVDHVVVGRAGVFLLDTKRLSGPALASADGLAAGRVRYAGAG